MILLLLLSIYKEIEQKFYWLKHFTVEMLGNNFQILKRGVNENNWFVFMSLEMF